jgi:hypothetical protein
VRVPRAALLTPAEARRCSSCGAVADAADALGAPLSDWQLLCLALLHQRALHAASAWAPYLAVLPPQPRSGESGGGDADDPASFLHPLLWPTPFAEHVLAGSPMLVRAALRDSSPELRVRVDASQHNLAGEAALARGDVR